MRSAALLLWCFFFGMSSAGPVGALLSFDAREDFPTGPSPRIAVPARVNEDDYNDLVIADDDGVSVLFGTPVGRLSAPLTTKTESATALLTAADFDGDGDADIAYADKYSNQLVLRRGDGTGGFAAWKTVDLRARPTEIYSADVDRDRRADLIVLSPNGLHILLNRGTRELDHQVSEVGEPISAATFIDSHGTFEIALVNPARRYLLLGVSNRVGQFSLTGRVDLAAPARLAATVPGQAAADLAVIDNLGVALLRGRPDGSYREPERLYRSSACTALAAADLNNDQLADLAVADGERGIFLLLAGDENHAFSPAGAYDIGDANGAITTFDLGRHQVPAAAVINRSHSSITLLRSTRDGRLAGAPVFGAGEGPIAGISRDIDGDHHLDLVIADERAGAVLVFLGNGHGRFSELPPIAVGRGTRAVTAGDFDGDGQIDLAAVNAASDDVAVLAGTGGGHFASPLLVSTGVGPTAITTLDADGDGDLDLAVANKSSRSVSILIADGHGRFPETRNHAVPQAPDFLIAGDLNGNGRSDLVVGNLGSDELSILKGGAAGLEAPRRYDKGDKIRPSIAADFDRDGQVDLAVVDKNEDRVGILLGSGDNTFREPTFFPVSQTPSALIVGDFNEDKRPDLIVISNRSRTILLLTNTSTASDNDDEEEVVVPETTPGAKPRVGQQPAIDRRPSPAADGGDPWRGNKVRRW